VRFSRLLSRNAANRVAQAATGAVDTSQRNQHGRRVPGRHLFVCTNGRSAGKPACGPRGGDALVAAVQRELLARKATDVLVTPCGCLGPCFDGPNAVVYPEGVWYAGLEAADGAALARHLVDGTRLLVKLSERPGIVPGDDADASP
jgi:(2Fe-2S) ferredoxin